MSTAQNLQTGPVPKEHAPCPSCKTAIPIYENECRWCEQCHWNLDPEEDGKKKLDLYTQTYRALGKKLSQKLYQNFLDEKVARPRFTIAKFLTYAFATLVHTLPILMLLGAYRSFQVFAPLIAFFLSVILVGIAWATCPKPRKLPKDLVSRAQAPKLYELLDRIADAMGTERIHGLAIDERFNAYYTDYGIGPRKKKIIGIGLPLAEITTDEELIAILSHETSHGANGDAGRGFFVGSAAHSLYIWYRILTPTHWYEGATWENSFWVGIANVLGLIVGKIPWAAYRVLYRLIYHQSQEAEYIADRLATEVCGTDAAISMLYKVQRQDPFYSVVSKAALLKGKLDLFNELKNRYEQPQSDHDCERINRLELKYGLSLDATHPPTPYRRDFLRLTTDYKAKVFLTSEDSKAIRKELDSFKKAVEIKLVDQYLSSIY